MNPAFSGPLLLFATLKTPYMTINQSSLGHTARRHSPGRSHTYLARGPAASLVAFSGEAMVSQCYRQLSPSRATAVARLLAATGSLLPLILFLNPCFEKGRSAGTRAGGAGAKDLSFLIAFHGAARRDAAPPKQLVGRRRIGKAVRTRAICHQWTTRDRRGARVAGGAIRLQLYSI